MLTTKDNKDSVTNTTRQLKDNSNEDSQYKNEHRNKRNKQKEIEIKDVAWSSTSLELELKENANTIETDKMTLETQDHVTQLQNERGEVVQFECLTNKQTIRKEADTIQTNKNKKIGYKTDMDIDNATEEKTDDKKKEVSQIRQPAMQRAYSEVVIGNRQRSTIAIEKATKWKTEFQNKLNAKVNDNLKLRNWLEFCDEQDYHVIAMQETKLKAKDNTKMKLANPYYGIYYSNCTVNEAKKSMAAMGIAIGIKKALEAYIHDIRTMLGTAIMLDLFMLGNNRVRIINVYITQDKPELAAVIQNEVQNWINQAATKSQKLIIMGNFNSNESKRNAKTKGSLKSQIDDIWAVRRKKQKLTKYNLNNIDNDKWQEFSAEIVKRIEKQIGPKPQRTEGTSINGIIEGLKNASKIKTSLNKHGLDYVEQMMNIDLTRLVEWKAIQHNLRKLIRGKTLGWIITVQNEIRGLCNPADNTKGINQFAIRSPIEKMKWVVTKEAVIGRVVSIEQNIVQIAHWKEEANNGVLKRCDGCKINENRNKKKRREPFIPHDMRKSYEISEHFNKKNKIREMCSRWRDKKVLNVQLSVDKISKGTRISLEKNVEHIHITNKNWPSIQKSILSTIAMIAVVMLNAAKINIMTDVKEMKQIVATLTKDAKRTKFEVNLRDKIEATNDDVQTLAIEIDYQNWVPNLMAVQLNGINICYGVRRLVRHICNAKILTQFYGQNRIQELNADHKVNWELTYDYINWDEDINQGAADFGDASDIVEEVLNDIEKKHKKQFENKKVYVKQFVEMYESGSELTLPNRIIEGSFIKDWRDITENSVKQSKAEEELPQKRHRKKEGYRNENIFEQ
ncbi:44163_t:CDS:10 [Gigaspora margarita]|uniref:44163_t:CDS:1 n=1 Tax=Gigaspora margarita TaxID=4874 RepID=A0ABN7UGQ1_GIGMA|nr:44163_t:CDS:10 [Gigaspora margarita]